MQRLEFLGLQVDEDSNQCASVDHRNKIALITTVQVKRTDRGTGLLTAKAEADDLAASVYPRRAQARQAEDDALTGNAESAENG